jgi:5-methyltetrahydrofolate--homocysteine methyltransferase
MTQTCVTVVTSPSQTVQISRDHPTVIIGERINPTGRKKVLAALQAGEFDLIRQEALAQVEAGAGILDVNAGVPGADEPRLMGELVAAIREVTDVPLCIDSANPLTLEAALSTYEGKALVNSVNGEKKSLEAILPLVQKHQAAVIGLCMDDDGIPSTPEARLKVAGNILEEAARLGIPTEDVIIDPLTLTMGSDHHAGAITLETIRLIVEELGVNVGLGASNVSFGLPDRPLLNMTFLAMALQAGASCPITNPLAEGIRTTVLAADLALGRDEFGMRWIKAFRERKAAVES